MLFVYCRGGVLPPVSDGGLSTTSTLENPKPQEVEDEENE